MQSSQKPLVVREATLDDRAALLSWYQDPIRQVIHRKNPIVTKEQHAKWFDSSTKSRNTLLCIGLVDIIRIGAIRFDTTDGLQFKAGLMIRPHYMGQGLSATLLLQGAKMLLQKFHKAKVTMTLPSAPRVTKDIFADPALSISEVGDGTVIVSVKV